jgi:tetratricopeptide (TPR) repeat protein
MIGKDDLARTLAATYVNLGNAILKTGDSRGAKDCFDKAINCCLSDQKPAIMLELIDLSTSKAEKRELLANCVQHLITNNIRPITPDPEKVLALTKAHLLIILSTLYELDNHVFRTLFEYVSKIEDVSSNPSGLLYELALHSLRHRKIVTASELAKSALHNNPPTGGLSQDAGFETLRLLCYITKGHKRVPYIDQFIEVLKSGFKPKYFGYSDLEVLLSKLDELQKFKKNKEILELVLFTKRFLPLINPAEVGGFVMFYVFQINALNARNDSEGLKLAVHECIEFVDALPEKNGSELFFGDTRLEMVKAWAQSQLQIILPPLPATTSFSKKFGRNDKITVRYYDGTVKPDVKFKKVEGDLKANKCIIVEQERNS